MKHIFKRTFCLLMAIQVLFAGTGFTLYEHWCLLKGTKTFSFFEKEHCTLNNDKSTTEHGTCLKRGRCCIHKVSYYKVQLSSENEVSEKSDTQPTDSDSSPTFQIGNVTAIAAINIDSFPAPFSNCNAPPLFGRRLLNYIQSLLI